MNTPGLLFQHYLRGTAFLAGSDFAWRYCAETEVPKDIRRPAFILAWPVSIPAGGCLAAYRWLAHVMETYSD